MPLNVILGKSNTGKSEYIISKIMACENEKKQAILFVPPTGRIMAEEEYLKITNKKAIIDTKITSFERYISKNVDKVTLYKNKKYLPELAKKMLVKKIINDNSDLFKMFSKVKDKTGFTDKIEKYMSKFNSSDILEFTSKYNENDLLKFKLEEFQSIYLKINEALNDKFVTSVDEFNFFVETLNSSDGKIDNEIFIDGYNNFSDNEFLLIQALLKKEANITISIDLDMEKYNSGTTEIYNTSYETYSRLKDICEKNSININTITLDKCKKNRTKDLEYLSQNIFSLSKEKFEGKSENIKLVLKANPNEEIKYIANDILKNISNGYSFKDIAIYTNNPEGYYINFKKTLELYNIPYYINLKKDIMQDEIVVYISSLFDLALNGLTKSIDNVLVFAKTGLLDINESEINLFEDYLLEFGIKGYNMYKPFIIEGNYDLEVINNVREKVINEIECFKKVLEGKTKADEITKNIYNYFIDSGSLSKYEIILNEVCNIDVNEYNRKKQVLSKIYEVMDSIDVAYQNISINDYYDSLIFGLKTIQIDTIPPKQEEVEIIDINKNRGTEKKIGYIIGCYDSGLPSNQIEDSIFSDTELEKLKENKIMIEETSVERNNMQLFNIYQAISKVREKLTFTLPASSNEGSSLRESSLISEVKDLLNIELESINNDNSYNINEVFKDFLMELQGLKDTASKDELENILNKYEYFKNIDEYNKLIEYSRKDNNLSDDTLNKLYKKNVSSSVSRLEQYKRCPFAYYSKYILNLNAKKGFEISTLDTGSFMHEVIEKFSKYLVSKSISWESIIIDEKVNLKAREKVKEIINKIFEEEYSKYLTEAKYVMYKDKITKIMTRTILAIADSFYHSKFRPLGYEIEFSKDSLFAPIEVDMGDGKKLLLKGKIDRIDSYDENDNTYLRIVDYKSSDKNLKLSDVKEGISLQLMTYMWAMLNNKEKVNGENDIIPAAISYFTISNNILNLPEYEENDDVIKSKLISSLKLKGIYISDVEILNKLDDNFNDSKKSYLEVTSRTLNNEEKVLSEDKFKEECNNVNNVLKSIGKEILKGNVKIKPNRKIKNVCEYCDYNTICRKNILN